MTVKKRDGTVVPFDQTKIIKAINAAFTDVDGIVYETDTAADIAEDIYSYFQNHPTVDPTVELIQDMIEDYLMRSERKDVAKAYIRYRYKREVAREKKDEFMQAISEKLQAKNVQNQNANVDEYSFGGRTGEATSVLTKQYALDYLISSKARKNHLDNIIYIHDLDSYAVGNHNCLSVPLDDLLAKGFKTRQCDIRPAGSVNTAFQLVAVIFQLQSLQQFGGVSATHLDWTMVPYVRKSFSKHFKDGIKYCYKHPKLDIDTLPKELSFDDKEITKRKYKRAYKYAMNMTEREIYQAVEGMYHNLNTLQSRSGNQLPFTSINYGTCTQPEGRIITKALLEVSLQGLGPLYKTPIFPCGIFQLKKGINRKPQNPNYDLFRLALQSTAKRLYPNYANCDWSGNAGYDPNDPRTFFSTMGCRTANGWDINGFGQLKDGRGNICPVTIILPTVAMMAKELYENDVNNTASLKETFIFLLEQKINEAKDMLIERFKWICSQNPKSAKFMYENRLMAGYVPEEGIRSALVHGTLALGQLGLAEALQILIGCDHTEPEGMEFAKEIEQLFKTRCSEFKEKYKLNFGVYMTPAENLAYTAMKKFKKTYGILPKISDRDYFTNSINKIVA